MSKRDGPNRKEALLRVENTEMSGGGKEEKKGISGNLVWDLGAYRTVASRGLRTGGTYCVWLSAKVAQYS